MNDQVRAPQAEDLMSVGTRISWGAILAGGVLALALSFLFGILGSAVGLSISDRVSGRTFTIAAVGWIIVTTCVSLFVGGLIVSHFTVGENKVEAVLYGIIMWALVVGLLMSMGAAGVHTGVNSVVALANMAADAPAESWVASAEKAGVPAEQIKDWQSKLTGAAQDAVKGAQDPQTREKAAEAATKVAWYAFGGTWISMICAALGALVGAGPTFRVVTVQSASRLGATVIHT